MRGAAQRRRGRRLEAGLLALALGLLAGCTYADREPGLFGRTPAAGSPSTSPGPPVPDSAALIPLLGEATWTTVGPAAVPVRIAVHAVRRVPGGTVLDWSITALSQPGRVPGDRVEQGLDLPLDEKLDVALVDAAADQVYRPLEVRDPSGRCLCTPVSRARTDVVLDAPRLLQVAFPELPRTTRAVDVSVALAPVFSRIPVTAAGQVPLALSETDLARPAGTAEPRGRTPDFSMASGQRFAIEVNAILASGTLTSVVWTLEARSGGPGPGRGLQPVLTRGNAWHVAPIGFERPGDPTARHCLCRDPADWRAELTEPGRRVTVVTVLGEVPRGTTSADVTFRGVPPLRRLNVTPAPDGTFRAAGAVDVRRRTWSYRVNRPQPGWPLSAWPTPVPVIDQDQVFVVRDRLVG